MLTKYQENLPDNELHCSLGKVVEVPLTGVFKDRPGNRKHTAVISSAWRVDGVMLAL